MRMDGLYGAGPYRLKDIDTWAWDVARGRGCGIRAHEQYIYCMARHSYFFFAFPTLPSSVLWLASLL